MLNKPFKVGITGGIGAGKSIVCEVFRILGVPVYHADEEAKMLMTQNTKVVNQIRDTFGEKAYHENGTLNREHLSATVFNDKKKLEKLNNIVHPAVEEDFLSWVMKFKDKSYVMKEAALLVESGSYKRLDYLLTVTAPEGVKIDRVLRRDPYRNQQDVEAIVSNQLGDEKKIALSKFVINNDNSTMMMPQILKIHEFFVKLGHTG